MTRWRGTSLAFAIVTALAGAAMAETAPLPVPSVTLYPGDALAETELTEKLFKVSAATLAAYATRREQLAGKHARRTLVAGRPIPLASLKEPDAVVQGVAARALFESEGLTIATRLVPLRSAAAGEIVEARNPDSGVIVRALALADGTLKVAP